MDFAEMKADAISRIQNIHNFSQADKPDYWFIESQPMGLGSTEAPGEVNPPDAKALRIVLYTERNEYGIRAFYRDGEPQYLGAHVKSRTCRAGETWRRGNDLPDGPYNDETWQRIFMAIIGYELVKIHQPLAQRDELFLAGGEQVAVATGQGLLSNDSALGATPE